MTITELAFSLDTFYLLMSAALVMWMAAGFSMLEAGLVRSKNTTEILVKNVMLYAIACTLYLLFGYHLMYGTPDITTHAKPADIFFQMVFVATAMSIVSGAVAERMKLSSFLIFCVLLTGVLYPIQGSWSWGGGFLNEFGFSDFAGSGIVHMAGAAAALAAVIVLGPRKGKYRSDGSVQAIPGANMPLATLGTFILWMGWFGFNGGSQLQLSGAGNAEAIANVFINTNAAAATGAIGAFLIVRFVWKKADLTMILNGALAGLVAITAAPDAPTPALACLIGLVAGAIVVLSIVGLDRAKIDDPVGAISVHGVVGLFGLLVVPLSNSDATLVKQLAGAGTIFGWMFVTSFVAWWILKVVTGIRVSEEDEYRGGDISDCGVEAYPEFITHKQD
ncbi:MULTISPECIES: ammonium transporter [Gammaproteobacteria]|uniref:ammonium transporter n=1 Tax=Gammaproteobacteria TaxID=1236 RepID=UPI000DD02903|nr:MULTISPECIES: ammonium transporter [Gammaproteobacteria]RTE85812.1 ammonium transporter [Aliidiomarina sp. B3213]TCZ90187.1 ammonium transporter [Lysobacter sp. N42]